MKAVGPSATLGSTDSTASVTAGDSHIVVAGGDNADQVQEALQDADNARKHVEEVKAQLLKAQLSVKHAKLEEKLHA